MKVLIADDSPEARSAFARILERFGATVVREVSDGQEAADAAEECDFDLMILDYNMPNMDGLATLKLMRSRGKTMPIIVISGERDDDLAERVAREGGSAFLLKPVSLRVLKRKIEDMLGREIDLS